jgi:hypothetical protein
MNKRIRLSSTWVISLCVIWMAAVASQAGAAEKKTEHFSAVAVATRGAMGGKSVNLDIYIKEYTSDEKMQELLGILSEGGPDALRRPMEKLDVGQISPTGRVGTPIAVARAKKTEKGTLISLVTARNMSFWELREGGRSTDYQFSVLQMLVDERGKGEGSAIVAAKIKFDKEGTLVIESYGIQDTVRLANVHRY